jgi:hypothetical protein
MKPGTAGKPFRVGAIWLALLAAPTSAALAQGRDAAILGLKPGPEKPPIFW